MPNRCVFLYVEGGNMRVRHTTVSLIFIAALSGFVVRANQAADISGTWSFAVDVDGTQGSPTFVFKQQGEQLEGTVTNPRGTQNVTGTIKGNKAIFGFQGTRDGQAFKATYDGTLESASKMTGRVEFIGSVNGNGTWVATRK
jgi:hypothetical protein